MKKFYLLASLMLLAACSKEALQPDNSNTPETSKVRIGVQAEQTRAALDGLTVKWQANDQIWVNSKTYSLQGNQASGWYLDVDVAPSYKAIYPASAANTDGSIVTLPAAQHYTANNFDPAAMIMAAEAVSGANLSFKNACGLVRLALTGNGEKVTSIALTGNSDENIAGAGSIGDAAASHLFSVTGTDKTTTLNDDSGVTLSAEETAFYFVVPQTTFAAGFTFRITTLNSGEMSKPSTKEQQVSRAVIREMPVFAFAADAVQSIDLSANGSANCYVVGTAGQTYHFAATVMGNGYTTPATVDYAGAGIANGITPTALAPQSAQVLWQTSKGLISGVYLKDGQVYFTLNGSESAALAEGNASIAVYSGANTTGDILWSWHIWVTAADLNSSVQTYTLPGNYANAGSTIVMDRNLGALKAGIWASNNDNLATGLIYQWGRKDPFPNIDDADVGVGNEFLPITRLRKTYNATGTEIGIDNAATDFGQGNWRLIKDKQITYASIAHYPMIFTVMANVWLDEARDDLWGNPYTEEISNVGHKSIYDPCPPGYRVPHRYFGTMATTDGANAVRGAANWKGQYTTAAVIQNNGGNIFSSGGGDAYYPLGGFYFLSNGVVGPYRTGKYLGDYQVSMPAAVVTKSYRFYLDFGNTQPERTHSRFLGSSVRCMKE